MSTSIFDGIEAAEVTGGSQYIMPGRHTLKVKNVIMRESRKPGKATHYFIVEFSVVQTSGDDHAVGSTATWLVDMNKPNADTARGNIKEFVMALMGCKLEEVTVKLCEELVNASQPGAGMSVLAEAWHKPTASGGVFTRISWSPLEDHPAAN